MLFKVLLNLGCSKGLGILFLGSFKKILIERDWNGKHNKTEAIIYWLLSYVIADFHESPIIFFQPFIHLYFLPFFHEENWDQRN